MVAVRWYLRYGLSYRDVEELLAERGIMVDHGSYSLAAFARSIADRTECPRSPGFSHGAGEGCWLQLRSMHCLLLVAVFRSRARYWTIPNMGALASKRSVDFRFSDGLEEILP
jgi:hypothetical protein